MRALGSATTCPMKLLRKMRPTSIFEDPNCRWKNRQPPHRIPSIHKAPLFDGLARKRRTYPPFFDNVSGSSPSLQEPNCCIVPLHCHRSFSPRSSNDALELDWSGGLTTKNRLTDQSNDVHVMCKLGHEEEVDTRRPAPEPGRTQKYLQIQTSFVLK